MKTRNRTARTRRAVAGTRRRYPEGIVMDKPKTHAAARIFGSGTSAGRLIWCECGDVLGPSWEDVREVIAAHAAEVEQ